MVAVLICSHTFGGRTARAIDARLELARMPAEHRHVMTAPRQRASENSAHLTGSPRYDHLHAASPVGPCPPEPGGGPGPSTALNTGRVAVRTSPAGVTTVVQGAGRAAETCATFTPAD
jgi:hypothetical protein